MLVQIPPLGGDGGIVPSTIYIIIVSIEPFGMLELPYYNIHACVHCPM